MSLAAVSVEDKTHSRRLVSEAFVEDIFEPFSVLHTVGSACERFEHLLRMRCRRQKRWTPPRDVRPPTEEAWLHKWSYLLQLLERREHPTTPWHRENESRRNAIRWRNAEQGVRRKRWYRSCRNYKHSNWFPFSPGCVRC